MTDQSVNYGAGNMTYSPVNYGYELTNLLNRYGVASPVAGPQDDLQQYNKTVSSTPMYDIQRGNNLYNQYLGDTQYGDILGYLQTRGISNPETNAPDIYSAAKRFGWAGPQLEQALGYPAGSAEEYIRNANLAPLRQMQTYGYQYSGANNVPSGGSQVPVGGSQSQPGQVSAGAAQPQGSSANSGAPFSGDELAYSINYQPSYYGKELQSQDMSDPLAFYTKHSGPVDLGSDFMDDIQNLVNHMKLEVRPEDSYLGYGQSQNEITTGEMGVLLEYAQRYGISPDQLAQMYGEPDFSGQDVVGALEDQFPHHAYNYLQANEQPTSNYSSQDINDFISSSNLSPEEIYDLATKNNVSAAEIDRAMGFAPGEANRWALANNRTAFAEGGLAEAEEELSSAEEALMQKYAESSAAPGMSKAELYWRLASAFADPGKTGSFGEGLGNAAGAAADYEKGKRESAAAQSAAQRQLAEFNVDRADRRLGRAINQAESEADREDRRLVREEAAQSTAGRQAIDEGYQRGTPEYQARVKEISDELLSRQMALLGIQGTREERLAQQANRLSATELRMLEDAEASVSAGELADSALARALELNPNTFDSSLMSNIQRKAMELAGSEDPKVLNTQEVENLLGQQALASLRTIFGGNPTEGERKVMLELQGVGSYSKAQRERIINNTRALLAERLKRSRAKVEGIRNGDYRGYTDEEEGVSDE